MDLPLPNFRHPHGDADMEGLRQSDFQVIFENPESPPAREQGLLSRMRPVMQIPLDKEESDPRRARRAGGSSSRSSCLDSREEVEEEWRRKEAEMRTERERREAEEKKNQQKSLEGKNIKSSSKVQSISSTLTTPTSSKASGLTSPAALLATKGRKPPSVTKPNRAIQMFDPFAEGEGDQDTKVTMRQKLAKARRQSNSDTVEKQSPKKRSQSPSPPPLPKQKLSKSEQLMLEVEESKKKRIKAKPIAKSVTNVKKSVDPGTPSTMGDASATVSSNGDTSGSVAAPIGFFSEPGANESKSYPPVTDPAPTSSSASSDPSAKPETMAEKLKRLMTQESLPTPTLSSAQPQDYTATLNKVVRSALAPAGVKSASATILATPNSTHRLGAAQQHQAAATQQGMLVEDPTEYQHPEDPGNFNLQYSLWSIGSIGVLVRSSVDAFVPPGIDGVMRNHGITLSTKLEYLAKFGCSKMSFKETIKEWVDTTFTGSTKCFRARVNPYFGKPMLFEDLYHANLEDEMKTNCGLSGDDVSAFLFGFFSEVLKLSQGNYLLQHEAGSDELDVLKAVKQEEKANIDLKSHLAPLSPEQFKPQRTTPSNFPLLPLDTSIFMFFHKANGRIPGTFKPKDFVEGHFTKQKKQKLEAIMNKRMTKRAEQKRKYEEKKKKAAEEARRLKALTMGKGDEEEEVTAPTGYQPTGFKFGQMT